MNRDIHDELLNQSILNKEKLIAHLLKEYLGKEPELEDYKKVTLGGSNYFEHELIMIDGIEVGKIQLTTTHKENSIHMEWEFIPTKY